MDNPTVSDLTDLIQAREQLCRRLETIEATLGELQKSLQEVDSEIEKIRRQRREMAAKGRRIFVLLQETRRELDRHDALIQQIVEELAAAHIGPREGAYIMNGLVIARIAVAGTLYTSLIERVDSG